jgi:hypothetical protein
MGIGRHVGAATALTARQPELSTAAPAAAANGVLAAATPAPATAHGAGAHTHLALNPAAEQHEARGTSAPPRVAAQRHASDSERNLPAGSSCSTAQPKAHHPAP